MVIIRVPVANEIKTFLILQTWTLERDIIAFQPLFFSLCSKLYYAIVAIHAATCFGLNKAFCCNFCNDNCITSNHINDTSAAQVMHVGKIMQYLQLHVLMPVMQLARGKQPLTVLMPFGIEEAHENVMIRIIFIVSHGQRHIITQWTLLLATKL